MKDNYSSWNIQTPDRSTSNLQQKVVAALRFGILAPSTHNSQPWLFEIVGDAKVIVRFNKSSLLPAADPTNKDAYISLGCLVENIIIAAKNFGLRSTVTPNFFSEIHKSEVTIFFEEASAPAITEEDSALFRAIPMRCNARLFFEKQRELPTEVTRGILKQSEGSNGIETHIVQDRPGIEFLATQTGAAVEEAQSKKNFRLEFSGIVKNNFTTSPIGMPAFSFGITNIFSIFVPAIFRIFDVSKPLKRVNQKAMSASSAIVVLSTFHSNFQSWLECGRILERQLLFLTSKNIFSSIHIAMAENPKYMAMLQTKIITKNIPLMIYRVGYSNKVVRHTPRKTLEQCLTQ